MGNHFSGQHMHSPIVGGACCPCFFPFIICAKSNPMGENNGQVWIIGIASGV
jgi:hypothetical protein